MDCKDTIVISGLSGKFPGCENLNDLAGKLYDHVDMVGESDPRWPPGLFNLPTRMGTIKNLDKFDSQFFGISGKQANYMAPQARLLLETTFEALLDAGLNPSELRGSRTGVYIGFATVETHEGLGENVENVSGYVMSGCHAAMFANRISYCFDFQGPSISIDTACSSSMMAFHQAMIGLQNNECDLAIVGGVNLCLKPVVSLQFQMLDMLSSDGSCKFLDESANGYVRSESCSICVLQRCDQAKRIYAIVAGSQTNSDGYKEMGLTYPSWKSQFNLISELNAKLEINPNEFIYYEAHGSGTSVGDSAECRAISKAICENKRRDPLLIGSVKSNLGHSEPASGMCSIAKICISLQRSMIPANLHLSKFNPNIESLESGLLKPCVENQKIHIGPGANLIGINSVGFGGVNVNLILKAPNELISQISKRNEAEEYARIPNLVLIEGRTVESCRCMIDWMHKNPSLVTPDFLALLQEIFTKPIPGFNYRSYMLFNQSNRESEQVDDIDDLAISFCAQKRPLWFVIPGMGAQWAGMGRAMMKLTMFADSIRKSAAILKPLGLNLVDLIEKPREEDQDYMMYSVMSMSATQIALIDCLAELGIEPDGYIGHSMGENICAYVDGILTREQVLNVYYSLVLCAQDTPEIRGKMAATNLSWDEAKKVCSVYGIAAACHNSSDSVTISGPSDAVDKLIDLLQAEKRFARIVDSCGIAFHSPATKHMATRMLHRLRQVMPNASLRERSSRWISTSHPEQNWSSDGARFVGPEYWLNNAIEPVLFSEAFDKVPKDATIVEISPHGLFRSILERSFDGGRQTNYISLMKRNNNEQNLELFLTAIGKLYLLGHEPKMNKLYPKVNFPVQLQTQSISPLVKWDHSESWFVTQYPDFFNPSSNADLTYKFDLKDPDQKFLADHCIDGRVLFPAPGYLILAWKTLARCKGKFQNKLPVIFEDVQLLKAKVLSEAAIELNVHFMEPTGQFTISDSEDVIVTGKILAPNTDGKEELECPLRLQYLLDENRLVAKNCTDTKWVLSKDKFYKGLRTRGYDYGPKFQCLREYNMKSGVGKLHHNGEWISFADSMLQIALKSIKTQALYFPQKFQSVRCDPSVLAEACQYQPDSIVNVVYDEQLNVICAPGLEITGLKWNLSPIELETQRSINETCQMIENNEINLNMSNDIICSTWLKSCKKYWEELSKFNKQQANCCFHYASLNFRDIMLATGNLTIDALAGELATHDCRLEFEFAGCDESGRRIMGLIARKKIEMQDAEYLWQIPNDWSMEEASTVPIVYVTAYYALITRGKLNPGETILIHSAASGIGQAALSICLARKCRVFCTVASDKERQFLVASFPELKGGYIGSSRDCSFEQHVLRQTNGRGCDIVLNSLSKDKLDASVRLLAMHGRFLQIGRYNLEMNNPLGMSAFLKNVTFEGIQLDSLLVCSDTVQAQSPIISKQKLQVTQLVRDGIKSGEVRPLKAKVFAIDEVDRAFRFMVSGEHIGKVVIKLHHGEDIK